MKARKIYQICLVLSGLVLSLCGIACLVVGTLLDHDSDLQMSHESRSRTYETQYWLGLLIIAFGGLLMLISPSLHKRKRMSIFNLFVCIPLLTCALVAAILHGAAYGHFNSLHQKRAFLEEHSYGCSNLARGTTTVCQCSRPGVSDTESLPVPCGQQKSLVVFHGAMLTFVALSFALLLGILVMSVILLFHFFQPQLAMSSTTSGQENEGFSHARGRSHGIHNDPPASQHPPPVPTYVSGDRPPSYESLLMSFDVTSRSVTYDVSDASSRPAVNHAARVRYRGQLSSRANHQPPGRAEPGESSSNEVLSSDEHENEAGEVDITDTHRSIPRDRRHDGQASDGQVTSNELDSTTRGNNQPRQQQTTSSEMSNRTMLQSAPPIPGRPIRNTAQPSNEHSSEVTSHESSNSRSHASLAPTASSQSEDYVYVDITQAHHPPSSDSAHIAVRYRGQLNSNSANTIQTRSAITYDQENTVEDAIVDINLLETTTQEIAAQMADSLNAIDSFLLTEEVTDFSHNAETSSTGSENRLEHDITPKTVESQSAENIDSLNLDSPFVRQMPEDAISENSLEIEILTI